MSEDYTVCYACKRHECHGECMRPMKFHGDSPDTRHAQAAVLPEMAWMDEAATGIVRVVGVWFEKMNLPTSSEEGKALFTQAVHDIIEVKFSRSAAARPAEQPAFRDFGPMSCCICGDPTITRKFLPSEEMIALHVCKTEQPAPPQEDIGCSMAARDDLGHGKDGHCSIRNEPCPRLCLLKQIGNLETTIRSRELHNAALKALRNLAAWRGNDGSMCWCEQQRDPENLRHSGACEDAQALFKAGASQPSAPPQPASRTTCLDFKAELEYIEDMDKRAAEPSVEARQEAPDKGCPGKEFHELMEAAKKEAFTRGLEAAAQMADEKAVSSEKVGSAHSARALRTFAKELRTAIEEQQNGQH